MKANSGAEMPRLHTHAAAPLLIDIADIRHEILGGKVGDGSVRQVMRHPSAPKPIRGGHARGSKALYSRVDVVAFFDNIAQTGVWPTTEAEAA
jgi:hypothetical protein